MQPLAVARSSLSAALVLILHIGGAQDQSAVDVYKAVFAFRFPGTPWSSIVVNDVVSPLPPLSGTFIEISELPEFLQRALTQQNPGAAARPIDRDSLPDGTKVLSKGVVDGLFSSSNSEEGWVAFRRNFGSWWVSLSDLVFTPDGLDALVFYQASCSEICGDKSYLWLHRSATDGRWTVRKRIVTAMS